MTDDRQFHFSTEELISHPELVKEKGVTELEISDKALVGSKDKLFKFITDFQKKAPGIFLKLKLEISVIDRKLVDAFCRIPCCLMFDFKSSFLDSDKKFFKNKIALLNEAGLVFGFDIDSSEFATMKKFKSCLDEVFAYYPNHIYIQNDNLSPTDKLSSQDIKSIENLSFALETFYTYGRSVPWFYAVVQSLHLRPSNLICDFSEWQLCNNCSRTSSFSPEKAPFAEIEKMQLSFLRIKYEEKRLSHVFDAASDLIKLHASLSVCDSDGTETELSLSYNPDDLLSPYAMDLASFAEEVCMEPCLVRIFATEDGADFEIV